MKKNTVTTEKKETATKPKRFAVIVNKEQVLETSSYNTVVGEIEKLKADKMSLQHLLRYMWYTFRAVEGARARNVDFCFSYLAIFARV